MPKLTIPPDLDMHYEVDDFTDPWQPHETIVLLHGNAESSIAWYAWVPHLAREFRVVRPDMRGHGSSTPMTRDYAGWSLDRLADDYIALLDKLKIPVFHLVGAKVGGTIAMNLAARYPKRVRTLSVVSSQVKGTADLARYAAWTEHMEKHGVESWAGMTMKGRLGDEFPEEGAVWWTQMMGSCPLSTQLGFIAAVSGSDISDALSHIQCPTLVIAGEDSPLHPVAKSRQWQRTIPDSELLSVPGNSYHIAASLPDRCAEATLEFIRRRRHISAVAKEQPWVR